jgi:hypothetical protein
MHIQLTRPGKGARQKQVGTGKRRIFTGLEELPNQVETGRIKESVIR